MVFQWYGPQAATYLANYVRLDLITEENKPYFKISKTIPRIGRLLNDTSMVENMKMADNLLTPFNFVTVLKYLIVKCPEAEKAIKSAKLIATTLGQSIAFRQIEVLNKCCDLAGVYKAVRDILKKDKKSPFTLVGGCMAHHTNIFLKDLIVTCPEVENNQGATMIATTLG